MAHSFSSIYSAYHWTKNFHVYGPWGRPDMALFKFTKNILNDKPIPIFNFGKHNRDFTYVDDIVSGITKIFYSSLKKNKNNIPAEVYNIGRGKKEKLLDYIRIIKKNLNKSYKAKFLKKQKGDIQETQGDISKIKKNFKYSPRTNIEVGIPKFIDWYKKFYKKNK